jgi:hypothetical protein
MVRSIFFKLFTLAPLIIMLSLSTFIF